MREARPPTLGSLPASAYPGAGGRRCLGPFLREFRITRKLARETYRVRRPCRRYGHGTSNRRLAMILAVHWGGRCHLCGGPVETFTPRGHPYALTIDHIKPRALGGRDTLSNLAPAHLACNMLKGDRQLAASIERPVGKLKMERTQKRRRATVRRRFYAPRRRF